MALAYGGGKVALEQVWLFIVAPLLGGVLAAVVFNLLHKKKEEKTEVDAE